MPTIILPSGRPSYGRGFARSASESEAPGLWKGLKGLWLPTLGPTDLTLRDHSGFGNHGTLTNMDQSDWVIGGNPRLPGHVLDLDGATNVVSVAAVPSLNDIFPVTYSIWIFARSSGGGGTGALFAKRAVSSGTFFLSSNGRLVFQQDFDGTDLQAISANNTYTQNTWNHVAVTWSGGLDASEDVKFYSNGQPVSILSETDGVGTRVSDSSEVLRIGNGKFGNRGFDGMLDIPAVHNVVLSPAAIKQLYEQPAAMFTRRRRIYALGVVAPTGAIMNQLQGSNLGADLFNGALI